MSDAARWSVMVVDDDSDVGESVEEYFSGEKLTEEGDVAVVTAVSDFSDALAKIALSRYDILVLDLRKGEHDLDPKIEAGAQLLDDIRRTRFLPIVFYTGLPRLVRHLENPPFIQVVEKSGTHERLLKALQITLNSQLPSMNRALVSHVDRVQRDYMWDFVASQWGKITAETDRTSVAYLLARRLAGSLSDPSTTQLARDLGSGFDTSIESGRIHAMQCYVMPPIAEPPMMAGDIYKGTIRCQNGYWVLVTPSCDLAQGKAEWLMLASCDPLSEQREFVDWTERQSNPTTSRLRGLVSNNRHASQRDRHMYLPAAMSIPDLVVDLQNVAVIQRKEFGSFGLERLATLDSPFAEALSSQFGRLFGRIGTPDLDVDSVMARLESDLTS